VAGFADLGATYDVASNSVAHITPYLFPMAQPISSLVFSRVALFIAGGQEQLGLVSHGTIWSTQIGGYQRGQILGARADAYHKHRIAEKHEEAHTYLQHTLDRIGKL
jgi:hypothetical protein